MATGPTPTPADGVCDDGTGACTLRAAIEQSNATPARETIPFAIGTGPRTIAPATALPTITNPVTIDATTQPGYAGAPLIALNGTGAGAGVDGLKVTAGDTTIRGLVVNQFRWGWRRAVR